MARTRSLSVLAAALLLAAPACSFGDSDDSASESADSASGAAPSTTSAGGDDGGGGEGASDEVAEPELTDVRDVDLVAAQIDRKIVYTGTVSSEVEDVASATRAARDAVAAEGGFVFGQEISGGTARVVLKVPAVRFEAAFEAVADIGEVTSQHIEADDVSEQYTDLESRLATLVTSIDRLRGFLAEAGNVDEISRLESELTRREAEHDVIAGQLRVLEDRTALGTITASFVTAADVATSEEDEDGAGGPPGFGRGLEVGWDVVVVVAGATATAAGFALPFVPLLVLAGVALWWSRRRAVRSAGGPSPA